MVILSPDFQTSIRDIYAIGGAVSPAYIEIQKESTFKERKHTNRIYTAVKDAVGAVGHIAARHSRQNSRLEIVPVQNSQNYFPTFDRPHDNGSLGRLYGIPSER